VSVHTYRNRFGEKDYRDSVAYILNQKYHIPVGPECILGTQGWKCFCRVEPVGVTSGVYAALLHLKTKGVRKIGLVEPFYTYHLRDILSVFGDGVATFIPSNADFTVDFAAIEKALGDGVGALIVTNPNNPSGRVLSEAAVIRLVESTRVHGAMLILDECYADMVWTSSHLFTPAMLGSVPAHVVVCRGFSKCLGIQSWRVGFLISHPSLVNDLMNIHGLRKNAGLLITQTRCTYPFLGLNTLSLNTCAKTPMTFRLTLGVSTISFVRTGPSLRPCLKNPWAGSECSLRYCSVLFSHAAGLDVRLLLTCGG
jgi:aspartate/methionine/tyrosine aminotransferase